MKIINLFLNHLFCGLLFTTSLFLQAQETLCELDNSIYPRSKDEMLKEVALAWQRPLAFEKIIEEKKSIKQNQISQKLKTIKIPTIHLYETSLHSIILLLTELSIQHDSPYLPQEEKGINFVLINPDNLCPKVSLSLRNLPLEQVLEFILKTANFHYEIENEVVVISPGRPNYINLNTEFFPISRATVIRMTGDRQLNQFNKEEETKWISIQECEANALKLFLQNAGIPFDHEHDGPIGAEFAYDGSQLIITQTPRNLEKIRNLLERYKEVYQVEIESKFIEVQEGALEEIGFRWNIYNKNHPDQEFFRTSREFGIDNNLRTLANAFGPRHRSTGDGKIITNGKASSEIDITNRPPLFPNCINIGLHSVAVGGIFSVLDNWRVKLIIDALEQHTGTDLMSAPKVTVLSGKTAKITVAQVLRYPQSFGDIQSAVGIAGVDIGNSSAGVTITAGTPQNFIDKNVGVEMEVTPFVEENGKSISLKLEPRVTEFEGFVEYGGRSIAISHDTTVDVPSGFFQPIFSTREIKTEVTIANGSTVIMGGLTREEVKQVNDKVPILGDIPLLGRLFRSKGETNQKRNLLIFVTANLVGIGGAPIEDNLSCVSKDDIFQNSTEVIPSGVAKRQ